MQRNMGLLLQKNLFIKTSSTTLAYHLKFLLAQVKVCCPISYCGISSLTTVAFRSEACDFEDQNAVGLASQKNKRRGFISHDKKEALTGEKMESTLTVAELNSFIVGNKSRNCLLKVKVTKDRNCYGKVKNKRRWWSWCGTECLKTFTLSLKSCCCMSNVPLHCITLYAEMLYFPCTNQGMHLFYV